MKPWPASPPSLIMNVVIRLVPVALGLALVVLSVGSAAASPSANDTTSRAFAIQVAVPGQAGGSAASVSAPPDAVGVGGSFAYPPADGSVEDTELCATPSQQALTRRHGFRAESHELEIYGTCKDCL